MINIRLVIKKLLILSFTPIILLQAGPLENSYKILGLKQGATKEEIRLAYRKMSMQWHPDKVRDKGNQEAINAATEKFKQIQNAYEALTKNTNNPNQTHFHQADFDEFRQQWDRWKQGRHEREERWEREREDRDRAWAEAQQREKQEREATEQANLHQAEEMCEKFNKQLKNKSLAAKALIHLLHTPRILNLFKEKSIKKDVLFILNNYESIQCCKQNHQDLKKLFAAQNNALSLSDTLMKIVELNISQLITIFPFIRHNLEYRPQQTGSFSIYTQEGVFNFFEYEPSLASTTSPGLKKIALEMFFDSLGVATLTHALEDRSSKLADMLAANQEKIACIVQEYQTALKKDDLLGQDVAQAELANLLEPTHATFFEEVKELFTKGAVGSKIKGLTLKTILSILGIWIAEEMSA